MLLLVLTACGASPEAKKARHTENADKFYANKQYKEAVIEYLNVLRLDGNNKYSMTQLAAIALENGSTAQSLAYLLKARELDPEDLDLRLKIAQIYSMLHKTADSRKEVEFILDKDPKNMDAMNLIATFATSREEVDDALARLKELEPDPKDLPKFNMALGALYVRKGDLMRAEDSFLEALKGESNFPDAHLALADLAVMKKDYTQAEQEYKAAAELMPGATPAQVKLADFYTTTNDTDAAKKVLEGTLEKNPQFLPALHRLARIALEKRDYDECSRLVELVFQKDSADMDARMTRAQMLLAKNEVGGAIADLEQIVSARPDVAYSKFLLGLAYMTKGDLFKSKMLLQGAVDLDPNLTPAVLRLAEVNVRTGSYRAATEGLLRVLAKDPGNLDAYLLLPEAVKSPQEVSQAIELLEKALPRFNNDPKLSLALGSLYLKGNNSSRAEDAIKEMQTKDPDSVQTHVLLGDIAVRKKDFPRAEQEYKAAADLSKGVSAAQMKLAEFYLHQNNLAECKRILSECVEKAPEFLPASYYLAKLSLMEKDMDGSLKLVNKILASNPNYTDAIILRAEVYLAQGRTSEAIHDLQEVLKINPASLSALEALALAYMQQSDFATARSTLQELFRLDPDVVDPRVRLAELDIRAGDYRTAIENIEGLHGRGVKDPVLDLLLGTAYLGNNEPAKASASILKYLDKHPDNSRAKHLYGMALVAQGKRSEAVRYFDEALNGTPPILESLKQLITIDIAAKNLDAALGRVTRQTELFPTNGELYLLLGRVHIVRKRIDLAEQAFLRAIELDPKLIQAYSDLAQVYTLNKKTDLATARLEELLKLDPKNIGALMLSGLLYQQKNEVNKARDAFEAVLGISPGFVAAANNLAYLYCEFLDDSEKALKFAKIAKDGAPEDPSVSDTLGWALYKRGSYNWALPYLQEGVSKLPDNPEVQFHLGMAYYQLGDMDNAKDTLKKAVGTGLQFRGLADAKKVLSEIPQ